jgi:hypothetical protein
LTRRLPPLVVVVFVVGLALHNLVMAELWELGVRGLALDIAAAWKDALLVAALAAALWSAHALPVSSWADRLALAFAGIVVVYWLLPQSWLGGDATARGEVLALRHHLLPVAAYFLGRLLVLSDRELRRIAVALTGVAVAVALWGLVDVYAVPLQWWRDSGVPGWFGEQLGLSYTGLSGLPENWVLNTGDEQNPVRRLVSSFLSPLATAYVLVVALLYLIARKPSRWTVVAAGVVYVGLLWTHTRAAFLVLAGGLVVLAAAQRRWFPIGLAVASLLIGVGFVKAFPDIGPSTSYTQQELVILRAQGAETPDVDADPLSIDDSSTASHLRNLRDGTRAVARHPQGYGLGNSGVSASRTRVTLLAGESTYTELGIDTGVAGVSAFVGWMLAVLLALRRRSAWMTAAWAAVLAIGVQTDVIGVHWIAYVVFALAGASVGREQQPDAPRPQVEPGQIARLPGQPPR